MKRIAKTFLLWLLLASAPVAGAAGVALPFAENFSAAKLGGGWTNNFAPGNSLKLADGMLQLQARANARAEIARSFGADFVRISCALKSDAAAAPSLLCLRWDDSSFIQLGLNSPVNGRLNLREVLGTYAHDYDLGAAGAGEWNYVAIELARDCIRYFASRDGKKFTTIHVSPRPGRFAGAPKLLALGENFGGKIFPPASPWIAAPSTETIEVSWFRDLRVEALAKKQLAANAAERRELATRGRDFAGEQELASPGDPTFASVSRHFPAIKWSREIVGVKDHPSDIGVAPDGSLQLSGVIASYQKPTAHFQIGDYRFGSRDVSCAKALLNGWMPMVTTRDAHDGLELEQTVFGWTKNFSPDEPLFGNVQLRVKNSGAAKISTEVKLVFSAATNAPAPLNWHLDLAAGETKTVSVCVPFKILESPATEISSDEFNSKLADTTNYWNQLIARGSRFEIPEPRVQNAYRAWLAYNFLNVAKRNGIYEVCDGSGFYNEPYGFSVAHYCNALDLLGYHDTAAMYGDSLLSFMHTNGLLAVNFGDTDTGNALLVMAEHYWLTRDAGWLRQRVPQMRKMCGWIIEQRHAALANADKEPLVTRGLIRYRPYADLLHPAADYFSNGYLWKGLDATARVFAEMGLNDEAKKIRREADNYLSDIQVSMNAAVFKDRGQKILPLIPDTHELWKESDGSADGYYGIIAPCLLEIGLPAVDDPKSKLITAALEQRGGLVAGIAQFHRMADHAYTYGYWLNALQRDDVKRAILGLYGSLAYGMSRDTFAAVECTSIQTGENYWMLPHTFSNTQQLRLLRNLLVREDGDTLWLGQAIPRDWLAPGQRVAVNDAPTTFGPVSYRIEAHADGSMSVKLLPPMRNAPAEILLRLRDPKHRKIARVKSTGAEKIKYSNDTVRLREVHSPVALEVTFR
jgi:hypothetical protein